MPALLIKHLVISAPRSTLLVRNLKSLPSAISQHSRQQKAPFFSRQYHQKHHQLVSALRTQRHVAHRLASASASMKDDPEGVAEEAALLEAFSDIPTITGAWVHSAGPGLSTLTVSAQIRGMAPGHVIPS